MKPLQEAIVKVREAERQLSGVRELLGKVAFPDSEELAQQHLTQQGSDALREISLLIDRHEHLSGFDFESYVRARLPQWQRLLPC